MPKGDFVPQEYGRWHIEYSFDDNLWHGVLDGVSQPEIAGDTVEDVKALINAAGGPE
jgi:hypothetical protein